MSVFVLYVLAAILIGGNLFYVWWLARKSKKDIEKYDLFISTMNLFDLLKNEWQWTQLSMARNKNGTSVGPLDPEACQWCLIGAIAKVEGIEGDVNEVHKAMEFSPLGIFLKEIILRDPVYNCRLEGHSDTSYPLWRVNDGFYHKDIGSLLYKAYHKALSQLPVTGKL